ncbi:MAG TPA: SIS domain-containing protein [Gaiellales bacterium]|jgi:glucosamine 6-phosphate synthetase-like amidotransferase/phosphosugar isomerase protein|nr:SIS domain-containing protein [Gaiellales bacterium]
MADLRPERFADDILAAPVALAGPAPGLESIQALVGRAERVLFLGMGSSRFAALDAAALLRAHGVDAAAEMASTGSPQPPSADTLVFAISATGGSEETVAAMRRHLGTSMVAGVTSVPGSAVGSETDACLQIAGDGPSGVACASYRSTVALLREACGLIVPAAAPPARWRERAAGAIAELIDGRGEWLPRTVEQLGGGAVHVLGPAERLGAAEQSALMLREVPRVSAYACETGDWSHVDVYLTKRPGYRALLLPGSAYEAEVREWQAERGFTIVTADVPGEADIRPLVETLVAELLAAELWAANPI